MRTVFLIFVCLNCALSAALCQRPAGKEILDTEARRFIAMTQKDTAFLKKLLADDLVYIHSNGLTETKQAHLAAISSGEIVYQAMTREPDVQVRLYSKTAITNGFVHVKVILKGGAPLEIRLRYSAVYRKQKGTWRLVNWQSTRS